MARLKVKAASLVEMVVAMLILSISITAASVAFVHYTDRSKYLQMQTIHNELLMLEDKITADSLFPESKKKYESINLDIDVREIEKSDSIFLVELNYRDSLFTHELSLKFIYAKD